MTDAYRSFFKNFGSAFRTAHIRLQWANLRRIKTRWMFFGVLSVVCTLVQHAVAAKPRVLGLEQLIQMALERSRELKMADQDIAAPLWYVNRGTGPKVRLDIRTQLGPVCVYAQADMRLLNQLAVGVG